MHRNHSFSICKCTVFDCDGSFILEASRPPDLSRSELEKWRNTEISISISRETTVLDLCRVFTHLDCMGVKCLLQRRNCRKVEFCMRDLACYESWENVVYYLYSNNRGVMLAADVAADVAEDERISAPQLDSIIGHLSGCEPIPAVKAGAGNYFVLLCDPRDSYADIEGVVAEAAEKGYDRVFVWGCLIESEAGTKP